MLTARACADPSGYGRIVRDAGRRRRGDRRAEGRDRRSSGRSARSTRGISPSTRRSCATRCRRSATTTPRASTTSPTSSAIARERRPDRSAPTRSTTCCRPRASTTASSSPRSARELNRRIARPAGCATASRSIDPATTWIDVDVALGPDVTLLPGTQLLGATVVGEDAVIGPDTHARRTARSAPAPGSSAPTASSRSIGAGATVGPFSYLRPGHPARRRAARSAPSSRPRTPQIGDGAKVPHLSYVGDAEIGEGTNIGAGTIFANYDGVAKHRTDGRPARVRPARNNTFVAPVDDRRRRLHRRRHRRPPRRAAGRARRRPRPQRNIDGWVPRKRAGHRQADAAAGGARGRPGDGHRMDARRHPPRRHSTEEQHARDRT